MSSLQVSAAGDRARLGELDAVAPHSSKVAAEGLVSLMAMLLGMSLALDRFLPFEVGPFTVTFLLGLTLGTLGYWVGVTEPALRRFLVWVVPFTVWAVVSLLANSKLGSLKDSAGNLIWLLLVPGIATTCLDRRRFRSVLVGLSLGAAVLLAVVVHRFARGARILDVGHLQFLGFNRNAIDITIVWLSPVLLWSRTLGLPRLGRWAMISASVLWLISSQGRTGLFALVMVPPVFLLLKPSSGFSRTTRVALVGAVAALVYLSLTTISIPGLPATQRISQARSGDRTSADQIRLLLNEKSLALTAKHPVTGVGFGLYDGQYDPVIDKGASAHIRRDALALPAHNTYYEILATTGIPGFLTYAGVLLMPLVGGIRRSDDADVRAITTGYVIVLFAITFHTSYGTLVALPLVVLLAALARARAD